MSPQSPSSNPNNNRYKHDTEEKIVPLSTPTSSSHACSQKHAVSPHEAKQRESLYAVMELLKRGLSLSSSSDEEDGSNSGSDDDDVDEASEGRDTFDLPVGRSSATLDTAPVIAPRVAEDESSHGEKLRPAGYINHPNFGASMASMTSMDFTISPVEEEENEKAEADAMARYEKYKYDDGSVLSSSFASSFSNLEGDVEAPLGEGGGQKASNASALKKTASPEPPELIRLKKCLALVLVALMAGGSVTTYLLVNMDQTQEVETQFQQQAASQASALQVSLDRTTALLTALSKTITTSALDRNLSLAQMTLYNFGECRRNYNA